MFIMVFTISTYEGMIMFNKNSINLLHKFYIATIPKIIWAIEKLFFYPKLRQMYCNTMSSEIKNDIECGVVIFDIGGNKGQSVAFFKKLFPNSLIHVFEPQESTYKKLLDLISKKRLKNVFTHNVGVSAIKGHLNFYESILDETSSFDKPDINSRYLKTKNRILLTTNRKNTPPKRVEVTTVDSKCRELGIRVIDIMKIDVEGHELEVLRGATEVLHAHLVRFLQIERHLDDMRIDNTSSISRLLKDHGYSKIIEIKHPFGAFYEDVYSPLEFSVSSNA